MVLYEQETCNYLNIPSLPKKKWDGKSSFKTGVAITTLLTSGHAYAIVTFDANVDKAPRVIKVFSNEQFRRVDYSDILIVPDYMNTNDVENWDIDNESKKAAERVISEAKELETAAKDESLTLPKHEYFFEHITNDEEAQAFIRAYNKDNHIKHAKVPTQHEYIVLRLGAIWAEQNKITK